MRREGRRRDRLAGAEAGKVYETLSDDALTGNRCHFAAQATGSSDSHCSRLTRVDARVSPCEA